MNLIQQRAPLITATVAGILLASAAVFMVSSPSVAAPGAAIVLMSKPSTTKPVASLELPIVGGIDGDTIKTQIDALPCPLCKVSIRIRGIDTPEKGYRAKCAKEKDLGQQASALTKQMIGSTKVMTVLEADWDKYGGRIDGQVVINGHNIGDELLKSGFAKPYTGKGPKPDWCS